MTTPDRYRLAMERLLALTASDTRRTSKVRWTYAEILRRLLKHGRLWQYELRHEVAVSLPILNQRLQALVYAGLVQRVVAKRRRGRPFVSYSIEDPQQLWEELTPLFPDLPKPVIPKPDDPGWEAPGFPG